MSDPTRLSEEEQARATLQAQTEEINRLERVLAHQYGDGALPVAPAEAAEPSRERLFSRRTLFGWAFATILVVFVIRMVLPVVFESVKDSIITSMREPTTNTAAPVVVPTPPPGAAPALPAEPATPGATATPAAPAGTAAPAPATGTTVIKIVKKR